jgi:hypothetical protein
MPDGFYNVEFGHSAGSGIKARLGGIGSLRVSGGEKAVHWGGSTRLLRAE